MKKCVLFLFLVIFLFVLSCNSDTKQDINEEKTVPKSNNANLSNLIISSGTINPSFSSGTNAYSVSVLDSIETYSVTPTAENAGSTIQIRIHGGSYSNVSSGSTSGFMNLNKGSNLIEILVTAKDTTTNIYSITVIRAYNSYRITVNLQGSTSSLVYVCWLEDESGNDFKNLYVCDRIAAKNLTGIPLPYWTRNKFTQNGVIDSITGASDRINNINRDIDLGSTRRFHLCFEIDRSRNANNFFDNDRPCFIYKSEVIDIDNLQASYTMPAKPFGWMSNDTTGYYGQQPKTDPTTGKYVIPEFAQYRLMTDVTEDNVKYIMDTDGDYNDLVTSLTVTVTDI